MSVLMERPSRGGGGVGRLTSDISLVEELLLCEAPVGASDSGLEAIRLSDVVKSRCPRLQRWMKRRESTQRSIGRSTQKKVA